MTSAIRWKETVPGNYSPNPVPCIFNYHSNASSRWNQQRQALTESASLPRWQAWWSLLICRPTAYRDDLGLGVPCRRQYMGMGRGRPPHIWGGVCAPSPEIFFILNLEMCISVHSPDLLSICFCTAIRPGPDLQYACQSDFPGWLWLNQRPWTSCRRGHRWIRDKFNHCQRQNTESQQQQLSQLFFRRSWVWGGMTMVPWSPLDPPLKYSCIFHIAVIEADFELLSHCNVDLWRSM